ncbi:hypothetical protein Q5741_12390 [Paenibacillus sp. JX-17]|uniref:Glycosyl transferase family 28 C-terminal domain-containing protein n=1 Tax=Paenibacillus lacisoli TaxID=3064525 RepID=A0ABT9CEZ5_9BACL|nr:hypothetical protein [Paenibacillus sp. JX-17]MDO7907209.1 hypothetical protein [Paenibacillus sp. JX-17]
MNICYYITDYGYGHAARSVALIRELLMRLSAAELQLTICSERVLPFLVASLAGAGQRGSGNIHYRRVKLDVGYVLKPGTVEIDPSAMKAAYGKYIESFSVLVQQERDFLLQGKFDWVISDISAIPFAAASAARIPSIGISNFTWYTACRDVLNEKELQPLYEAYRNMDYFISLPGAADEPDWGRQARLEAGFYSRPADHRTVLELRQQLDPYGGSLIVYFAIGMGMDVQGLETLRWMEDNRCLFIVSSNMPVEGKRIIRIPREMTESQLYLAASDLVISKPGWGTASEAVQYGKPMLLIERGAMPEDRNTIDVLRKLLPVRLLRWEELADLNDLPAWLEEQGLSVRPGAGMKGNSGEEGVKALTDCVLNLLSVPGAE